MKNSIKTTARTGGILYLINIVLGFFAIGYVPGIIIVSGNPAATAHNILLHEQFYRLGLAAHIIILLTNIPLAVIFYQLFKVVNRRIILLVVFFTLIGTAIESVNLLNQFASLILLKGGHYLNVFTPEQLDSLSYMHHQLEASGFNLALVFFGSYCILIGYLIFRSTFLPGTVGMLMAIGGMCYLVNSFSSFLFPEFAANLSPYIQIPSGLAELSLCLWFLVKGVNVSKWEEKANARRIGEA
ncbi:MAG: hypothetical protein JWN83_2326 [Chitinophagaceae bacterium]|nr:hypothetical protein [Chitinophagaceae bacterium]